MQCKTCEYWDQRYPQNDKLGVCLALTVTVFTASPAEGGNADVIGLLPPPDYIPLGHRAPDDGYALVRTVAGFGCVGHKPSTKTPA